MFKVKNVTWIMENVVESHGFEILMSIISVFVLFVDPSVTGLSGIHIYGMKYSLVTILLYCFFEKTKKFRVECIDQRVLCIILFMFGFFNTSGINLYYEKKLPDTIFGWVRFIVSTGIYDILFYRCLAVIENFYKGHYVAVDRNVTKSLKNVVSLLKNRSFCTAIEFLKNHVRLCVATFILLCWIPWIIAYYPASIEVDTYWPIEQFLGLTERSNHHPWFYSIVVGSFYKLGLMLGDKNAGIFIYIWVRDVFCAFVYASVVVKLKKLGAKSLTCTIVTLFYAITPVFGAYAKHAFKNTVAAALFTLFILTIVDSLELIKAKKYRDINCISIGISALFFCLFLNNGIYVVLPVIIIICVLLLRRTYKISAIILIGIILLFFVYHNLIINYYDVKPTSRSEALAIPIQQVARTIRDKREDFSHQELEIAKGYDLETIAQAYDPLISDPVKDVWLDDTHGAKEFIRLWVGLLPRYSKSYIEAFVAHTYGYYAFTPREVEHAGNWNCGMTIFDWVKDTRYPDEFTCDYVGIFESLRGILDDWAKLWDEIPLLSLTDVMPLYTWCIVLFGGMILKKRDYMMLIPVFAMILMILTCVASPVNGCFRYFIPVAAAFPMMLRVS
ncbi:hypothetical protein UYO_1755 [Lachnospiraceae bacterium JC7]|nr:hypothetical protein UYO_1755 [Lachnospiraceae bacterium JC7]